MTTSMMNPIVTGSRNLFRIVCIERSSNILLRKLHVSSHLYDYPPIPPKWLKYNDKIFPPQEIGEERRPAYVCHMKNNIKYSPKKMWYIAVIVRGLQIDEAIDQLRFVPKKGAVIAKETLEEAKELAIKEHNVEFGTNLWVSESFVGRSLILKGARRHARGRMGLIHYRYCHYFVTLEEGNPPKDYYYWSRPLSPQEKLDRWLQENRERTIPETL